MLSYRVAKFDEISIISDLSAKIWEPTYKDILSQEQMDYMYDMMYSFESLQCQMEQQGQTFLLFSREGVDVGYVSIEPKSSNEFIFQKIYLLPSEQGHGTGRYMVESAIAYLKQHVDMPMTIRLFVNRGNRAVGFYKKIGFVVAEERDTHIGNGYYMNDYIMEIKA